MFNQNTRTRLRWVVPSIDLDYWGFGFFLQRYHKGALLRIHVGPFGITAFTISRRRRY